MHFEEHQVNLCVVKKLYSEETHDFVAWTLTCKHARFIAHNAAGYDSWLIFHSIVKQKMGKDNKTRDLKINGSKIMSMTVGGNVFMDSYCHVATKLEKFGETFGLQDCKKGFFHTASALRKRRTT